MYGISIIHFSGFPSGGIYVLLLVLGPSGSLFESSLDFITMWNSWFGYRLWSPLSCYLTCTTRRLNFVYRKGDYYRYIAEFKTEEERKEAADQSLKGYQARPMFVLLVLIVFFTIIFFYYFCRMPLKKPTLSCPQPIQFDSVLLSTFQFSTTKSWILPRGTVVPSDFSVLFDVRKN